MSTFFNIVKLRISSVVLDDRMVDKTPGAMKTIFNYLMQALILANGKGTVLRPLTVYTPKPIIPIVNKPLLLYQIEILKRAGVEQITLFTDYQPGKIEHLVGHEEELGVELRYVVEPQPLGTAGAYKFASKYSQDRTIILNGDILSDFVIAKLLKRHQGAGADFSIATTKADEHSKFGAVKVDDGNRVIEYVPDLSKTDAEDEFEFMNAGIYVAESGVSETIPQTAPLSFKHEIFPEMLKRNQPIHAFPIEDDYWCSIDSLEKYLSAHTDFLNGELRNFKLENGNDYERATSAFIDEKSVIDDDCVIKSNAKIINSVLGKGVQIEESAIVENSVVWARTRISSSARIKNAIIASSCYIGKNSVISEGAVLGDKVSLTDYSRV